MCFIGDGKISSPLFSTKPFSCFSIIEGFGYVGTINLLTRGVLKTWFYVNILYMVPYVCYPRFLSQRRKKSGCNKCNRKKLHGNITFMTFNGLYKLTSYFQSTKSLKPWRLRLLKERFPAFLQPLHNYVILWWIPYDHKLTLSLYRL